jgi:hypothetical protein
MDMEVIEDLHQEPVDTAAVQVEDMVEVVEEVAAAIEEAKLAEVEQLLSFSNQADTEAMEEEEEVIVEEILRWAC